jgi:uncharacterized membrane protein
MSDPKGKSAHRLVRHLRNTLLSGIFVLVPLAVTVFVFGFVLASVTAFARPLLLPWRDSLPAHTETVLSFVLTTIMVYAAGLVTAHVVGRRLLAYAESLLRKVPLIGTVYSSSKQVMDTFSASGKAGFKAVALVEFPGPGSLAVGFITGTTKNGNGAELFRVFIPTTPNPTSGFLLLMEKKVVQIADISVEDAVKMIVSGGVLAPEKFARVRQDDKDGET